MLRSSVLRASSSFPSTATRQAFRAPITACVPQQTRKAHAISNPTLANIEARWESMPPQEQADLWMALRDRMKTDWHELTMYEKKAAYWIAFGPHGPRAEAPPGESWKVARYTAYGVLASVVIFSLTRYFARPPPRTMTKEYQEMSNEYLRSQKSEPITGFSAENYKGKGMVQSKPAGKRPDPPDSE